MAHAVTAALREVDDGLRPDYVAAHGSGTRRGDASEGPDPAAPGLSADRHQRAGARERAAAVRRRRGPARLEDDVVARPGSRHVA